jgi:hypothetical protein
VTLGRGKRLNEAQQASLEWSWRRGHRYGTAALRAQCSQASAVNYFADFERRGIPRGVVERRARRCDFGKLRDVPRYDGPAMIGVAIPSAMPVDGWIGGRP